MFIVDRQNIRKSVAPTKYRIYWDSAIPMQYYDEDFIEFEDMAAMSGMKNFSEGTNNLTHPEFILDKFAKYEKFMKADRRREWRRYMKCKAKSRDSEEEKSKVCIIYFKCSIMKSLL